MKEEGRRKKEEGRRKREEGIRKTIFKNNGSKFGTEERKFYISRYTPR
jgi:hypothetical protein